MEQVTFEELRNDFNKYVKIITENGEIKELKFTPFQKKLFEMIQEGIKTGRMPKFSVAKTLLIYDSFKHCLN